MDNIPLIGASFKSDYIWITPNNVERIKVDLTKHYGYLFEGRNRYTRRFVWNDGLYPTEWTPNEYINWDNVKENEETVEFDIVNSL